MVKFATSVIVVGKKTGGGVSGQNLRGRSGGGYQAFLWEEVLVQQHQRCAGEQCVPVCPLKSVDVTQQSVSMINKDECKIDLLRPLRD